jgi:hypothetical protein
MYLRITRGRFDPARYDESVAISQDIAAAIARLPGFVRYQGGGNRATGAIVAVSTWDNEEHARFPREQLGEVVGRLQAAGAQLEPPEIYEIVVES